MRKLTIIIHPEKLPAVIAVFIVSLLILLLVIAIITKALIAKDEKEQIKNLMALLDTMTECPFCRNQGRKEIKRSINNNYRLVCSNCHRSFVSDKPERVIEEELEL